MEYPMKKIVLTMLSMFVLSIGTTVLATDDISGEYTNNYSGSAGSVKIKSLGNNEYSVEVSTYAKGMNSYFTDFKGKGTIDDGVLLVKNPHLKGHKGEKFILRIYFDKHKDIETAIANDKLNFKKETQNFQKSPQNQVAIIEDPDIEHDGSVIETGGYYYNVGASGDTGFTGVYTKKGVRASKAKDATTAPTTQQAPSKSREKAQREEEAREQAQREVKAREQSKAALEAAGVIALSPNTMNWKDARVYCESKGGRLPLANGRTSWNGDGRGFAPIEAFGAVGSPWPSWLPSDQLYWTGTRSTACLNCSWDVRINGGRVDVGSNEQERLYRVICIRR